MKNQAKLFFQPLNAIEMIYRLYLKQNVIGSFLKKNVNSSQRLACLRFKRQLETLQGGQEVGKG